MALNNAVWEKIALLYYEISDPNSSLSITGGPTVADVSTVELIYRSLTTEQRKNLIDWDVYFTRKESMFILWPLGRQRVFCKVGRTDYRKAQQESVGPGSILADSDISLPVVTKITGLPPAEAVVPQQYVARVCSMRPDIMNVSGYETGYYWTGYFKSCVNGTIIHIWMWTLWDRLLLKYITLTCDCGFLKCRFWAYIFWWLWDRMF